jgi:uncharacterized protein
MMPMHSVTAGEQRSPSLFAFFLLTFALAVPFWVFGAKNEHQLLPGLPVAALMFACPGSAALILVTREQGAKGARALLVRAFDYKSITPKIWYAPLLLLNPTIFVLSYAVLNVLGRPAPTPNIQILPAFALCLVFFVAALGEELGWSGYAIDPMQYRWGELRASLLLGAIWAALHFVPLSHADRSLVWISWWSLWTVAQRVIMVRIYNRTRKRILGTILLHASTNVSWQLFPIHGSFFDPSVTGLITTFAAILMIAQSKLRGGLSTQV